MTDLGVCGEGLPPPFDAISPNKGVGRRASHHEGRYAKSACSDTQTRVGLEGQRARARRTSQTSARAPTTLVARRGQARARLPSVQCREDSFTKISKCAREARARGRRSPPGRASRGRRRPSACPGRASRSARATRPIPRRTTRPRHRTARSPRRATRRPRSESPPLVVVRQGPPARPDRRRGRRRGRPQPYELPRSRVCRSPTRCARPPTTCLVFTPSTLKAHQAKETVKADAADLTRRPSRALPGPDHARPRPQLGLGAHRARARARRPAATRRHRQRRAKGAGPGPAAFVLPTKGPSERIIHGRAPSGASARRAAPCVARARPLASRARAGLLDGHRPRATTRLTRVLFFFSRCASARRGGKSSPTGTSATPGLARTRTSGSGRSSAAPSSSDGHEGVQVRKSNASPP